MPKLDCPDLQLTTGYIQHTTFDSRLFNFFASHQLLLIYEDNTEAVQVALERCIEQGLPLSSPRLKNPPYIYTPPRPPPSSRSSMDDSYILGEELPLPTERLFERLAQIPGYVWDQNSRLFRSSYDHWHVTGVRLAPGSDTPIFSPSNFSRSKDSSSSHTSPRFENRSHSRHHWRNSLSESSSDVSFSRNDDEHDPAWIPVVARISSHVIRLEREFHTLKSIIQMSDPECQHTVRPIDMIRMNPQPGDRGPLLVTIYEALGPNSLRDFVGFGPSFFCVYGGGSMTESSAAGIQVPIATFLEFAIGACECLELLHYGLKCIHGEIRPDAFHFNSEAGTVKIVTTGNGARSFDNALSEGWSILSRELGVKNKLQFIAPEQTGRLPTEPDSRTDIYALGVMFWSMLVGQPAFEASDPVEVVQKVLGKQLPLVSHKRMDVPDAASAVIQKMTQKQIDDRYYTISSVKWDLQQISRLLGDGDCEGLKNFVIAQRDVSSFFALPATMFGRKEEHGKILEIIHKVQKRQQAIITQASSKSNIYPLYAHSSNSSLSDSRLEGLETGDGSSDSGSCGIAGSKTNSTAVPCIFTHTSTQDLNHSGDSSSSQKTLLISNRVKSPIDLRTARDANDHEGLVSSSLVSLGQFDSLASLGRRKVTAKYHQSGRCEVISISGVAGLGKSDLINRLQPEIRKNGYVAVARLDRSRRVPFEPFFKFLASLLRQIFSERDVSSEYHTSIRSTLQPIWLSLHRVLGLPENLIYPLKETSQPVNFLKSVSPLPALKEGSEGSFPAKNAEFISLSAGQTFKDFYNDPSSSAMLRFADTLLETLRVMSFHKLICVCLDDIQYADAESVHLLLEIINKKIRCVVMITSRPEEINSPELKALFQTDMANVTRIELARLSEREVLEYVAATMHQAASKELLPLAAVVLEKSQGVPFYMRMMLETCYQKNCLWYSWRDSAWQYDLDRIFSEFVAPSYGQGIGIDFIAKRFQELPSESRSILLWAALLGSPFSFTLVQRLLSGEFLYSRGGEDEEDITCPRRTPLTQTKRGIVSGLQHLLQLYIILPGETDDEFRFAHDRYAQAVTTMRECHNQEKMHFIAAQTIMKYGPTDSASLYSRAQHIRSAARLIKQQVPERIKYRDALYHAALTASRSGAKSTALSYFQACLYLLQDDPWDINASDVYYDETRELHIQTAEMFIFNGKPAEAMDILSIVFERAHTPSCKARAWTLKSRIRAQVGDISGALEALLTSMEELGVKINRCSSWEDCDKSYAKLSAYLKAADLDVVFSAPLSEDPSLIALGALMGEAMGVCIWGEPLTFLQLGIEMMNIYLFRGSFAQIAYLCTYIAMIAMSRYKDLDLGIKLSNAAVRFMESYNEPWIPARAVTAHNFFVNHMRVPMATTLPLLEGSTEAAFLMGERYLILMNISAMVFTRFCLGHDLGELEALCNYGPEELCDWENDPRGGVYIISVRQAARALQGKTFTHSADHILSDGQHDGEKYLAAHKLNSHTLNMYRAMSVIPLYLYGHHEKVVEIATEMTKTLPGLWSLRASTHTLFYLSLALLSLHIEDPSRPGREDAIRQAIEYKQEIDCKASACDANYGMWSLILEGVLSEASGNFQKALAAFEAALDHTQLHNWPLEEALALELQVDFLVRRGVKRAAQYLLRQAITSWNTISATGKARQLSEKYEWLLRVGPPTSRISNAACQTIDSVINVPTRSTEPSTNAMNAQLEDQRNREWLEENEERTDQHSLDISGLGLDIIDLSSILEFSQVMSSELHIDKLLQKMVGIILESCSGSEIALVITDFEPYGWLVAAAGDQENGEVAFADGLPFSEVEDKMAQQITHYTLRTREPVLVHNVLDDERFSNVSDAYAARNPQGRSVIALPIIQAKNLLGVIHIEGKPNSFTQRNLVVLRLVCNQVGISLANAFLYRNASKVSAANAAMVEAQKRALAHAREAERKSKVAEAEAKHNVKLKEDAAKAKSIFLANVSHDLRTPMNGVIGLTELLKKTSLDREQNGYVDSIRVCADTLLTLINDILDFSKLEAGKMKVTAIPLNLRDTILEAVRALCYTHRHRGLQTIEDLDELDPNLLVMGDPVRLHQIFMNLLSNSYKFTPQGSVTVNAKSSVEEDGRIRITCKVVDTGIGIPGEQLVRLFRPFSQADSSSARSFGGSGLGLSICKAIIEDVLGGKIWLQSEEGVGTTVTFSLVFSKAPKDAVVRSHWSRDSSRQKIQTGRRSSIQDLKSIPRTGIRVCVAEDNPINQKIAVTFVRNLGLECEAFSDGQQAVEALRYASAEGNPFHLVLMDVQMPVLDGYNATRRIRQDPDPNVNDILVIAMTASAIEGDREKCIDAGMNNYLAKPVRSDVLKTMLNCYLSPSLESEVPMRSLRWRKPPPIQLPHQASVKEEQLQDSDSNSNSNSMMTIQRKPEDLYAIMLNGNPKSPDSPPLGTSISSEQATSSSAVESAAASAVSAGTAINMNGREEGSAAVESTVN
ncbi:serine/threonine protein kinase [Paracoccidioides brasiliensis]|nr:serine/threonine protein kinase [Paracoccidioides brasiliensis]